MNDPNHFSQDWDRDDKRKKIGYSLNGGNAICSESIGDQVNKGEEAGALASGRKRQSIFGFPETGAQHVDNGDPGMDRENDRLQSDRG